MEEEAVAAELAALLTKSAMLPTSLFNLKSALAAALEEGITGELVIKIPRKTDGSVEVGWRSGC